MPDQDEQLAKLASHAAANGVDDLRRLGKAEIAALEPELSATAALFSPSTGIIDSHAYMLALAGRCRSGGRESGARTRKSWPSRATAAATA